MAHLEDKILPIIKDYQSVLLLDYLIEFRDGFIARIISRWLRAELMDELEDNSYTAKPLEKRIQKFFKDLANLPNKYEAWYKALNGGAFPEEKKQQFDRLNNEIRSIIDTIKIECRNCISEFPNSSDLIFSTEESQIDRRCETSAAARRIGLGIDHYICSKSFRDYLRPPPNTEASDLDKYGLRALFAIVPFKVDYPDTLDPEERDDKSYKWKDGGTFRVLLPRDVADGNLDRVKEFLPLLNNGSIQELEEFHQMLEAMASSSTFALQEWQNAQKDDCCQPVKYIGTNCFVYSTEFHKCDNASHYVKTCLLAGNVNFVQLVPSPQNLMRGFFQLQSPFPGLVETLFPFNEFNPDWNHLVKDGNSIARGDSSISNESVVIEMPRSRNKWLNDWIEKGSSVTPENVPVYCLELIYWIRHSVTPWSEKFYQQLQNLDIMSASLVKEITPLINEKYQQMLYLLESPLATITQALSAVQSSTQELRAVLYEPAKALFGSYTLLSELFSEKYKLSASKYINIEISHNGEYKDGKVEDGKVVLAFALCRIFGRDAEMQDQRTKVGVIDHAKEILEDCELNKNDAFGELIEDLIWLLKNKGATGEPTVSIGLRTGPTNNTNKVAVLSRVLDGDPNAPLNEIKNLLFAPFKIHTKRWHLRAIILAVRSGGMRDKLLDLADDVTWEMNESFTPCSYHTLLSFIADLAAVAPSLKGKSYINKVNAVSPCLTSKLENHSWTLTFTFNMAWFDANDCGNLRDIIYDHVLNCPRDWRVFATNAGNFRKPFIDLAGRLLGITNTPHGWERIRPKSMKGSYEIIVVGNRMEQRRFSVTATKLHNDTQYTQLVIQWCGWAPDNKHRRRRGNKSRT